MKLLSIRSACVCLMVCFLFMAQSASAENKACAFTVTPAVGAYAFDGDQDLDNGVTYGLTLGLNLDERWAVEAGFNYVGRVLDADKNLMGGEVDAYIYHIDSLYHFMPANNLVPYVAAGLGTISFDPKAQNLKSIYFAANYGGGLKYFMSENVALRADVRNVISFDQAMSFNHTQSNFLYTVGVTFSFGGVKAKAAHADMP